MQTQNPNFNASGAGSGEKALSVPQIDPVFSYPVEGGNIFVYLVKSGFATFVFVSFDDTYSEYAYAVETLVARPALVTKPFLNSTKVVYDMLESAEKEFYDPFISNPFTQLLKDHEAMSKLLITVQNLLEATGE
jgi:hypothetical protein